MLVIYGNLCVLSYCCYKLEKKSTMPLGHKIKKKLIIIFFLFVWGISFILLWLRLDKLGHLSYDAIVTKINMSLLYILIESVREIKLKE